LTVQRSRRLTGVMLSAIAGALILLSIGILAAHAMDVFRSER